MNSLFDKVFRSRVVTSLLNGKGSFVIEENFSTALIFTSIFKKKPANLALICSNQYNAQRLYEFMLNFNEEKDLIFFPNDELLRAQAVASSRELLAQRLYAMGQCQEGGPKILITHTSALLRYLPSPMEFKANTIHFSVGAEFDIQELKRRLVAIGYESSNRVERSMQFSSRGDILDIYSVSYLDPIRIEFFGDEVESIRRFDLQTQESVENLEYCEILPSSDIFLDDERLISFQERAKKQIQKDKALMSHEVGALLEQNVNEDVTRFINHDYRSELYRYYGFALGEAHSILEYLNPEIVFFTNKEQFDSALELLKSDEADYLGDLFIKGRSLSSLRQYMGLDLALPLHSKVIYSHQFASDKEDFLFQAHSISTPGKGAAMTMTVIQTYMSTCEKIVLSVPDIRQFDTIKSLLEEQAIEYEELKEIDLPHGRVGLTSANLNEGFELPFLKAAFITANELFGKKAVSSRFASRFKNASILKSYEDLKPGDYVVHEYYGIGQYIEVTTIEVDGIHRDFLHIAYAGNEILYVPLEQFRLVRKYAGREGATPKLSRLSAKEWERRKSGIKKRVNELADRLIALYRDRASSDGFAFPPDDEFQQEFEADFPYQLTPDQESAVKEIKADMEKPEIMDRLLCGDVGFGKTEVAFRAAFKAISSGKQVAILCPTTLLARQHYEVALKRFGPYGVRLALLSRLVPEAKQEKYIGEIKKGDISLVIGTHRLLSKSVEFKDLGLLIVDEEQRFGVEQKERIKEMKSSVDVLTLSATPIPRTLQMSLIGIRPISEINTPPTARMPIQTYVIPQKNDICEELITRELSRHGQVFYVHNKVETIYHVASRLANRISLASVGVVHGQMDRESIEDVMGRFYDGEINLLVCTSIIENGIDIPNANLLIVEEANHFGLSQLYQIKGRVGRGDRIAYAYLLYKEGKKMTEDGQKRLQAIQEFTELGSGYKIAQRDLMIRGAGDLLGPEQAGFIDSVGLDLYLKMLHEAIEEKKTGIPAERPTPKKLFTIDAYLPSSYVSESDKVDLYHQLEDISSEKELNNFRRKLRDIYGKLPPEVELVLQKKYIDMLGEREEFESIDETENGIEIILTEEFASSDGIATALFNSLLPHLSAIKVRLNGRKVKLTIGKTGDWMKTVETVVRQVHKTYIDFKSKPRKS